MKLTLFVFGTLKNAGFKRAADHYLTMLKPWINFEQVEIKALAVPDKSSSTRQIIQHKESVILTEVIGRRLSSGQGFYILDEGGRAMATRAWAQMIKEWESRGQSTVVLCVGSSLGFSAELKKKAAGVLSLGPQTMSHELARIVLLEQLYRAFSILRGHPYHNEG